MDTNAILSKLKDLAPGKILESSRFGRSGVFGVWVEGKAIRELAFAIANDAELGLDWLENFSVAEIGDALVASYFLRSTRSNAQVILRSSVVPTSPQAVARISSVREFWPMAAQMEDEAAELFGIRFLGEKNEEMEVRTQFLGGSPGFPMRKSYQPGGAT